MGAQLMRSRSETIAMDRTHGASTRPFCRLRFPNPVAAKSPGNLQAWYSQ